jgi:thymidylate kinase
MYERDTQIVSAYLAHPFLEMPSKKMGLSSLDIGQVYDLLRRNRVILRTMNFLSIYESTLSTKNALLRDLVASSPLFAQAQEFAFYQRNRCVELVKAMTENGIDIMFIKSVNDFPLDSHNFDILLKEKDLDFARQIVENLGYRELAQAREVDGREPFKWFYRKVEDNRIVSVHLHVKIAWAGVEILNSNEIWNKHRRVMIGSLWICFPSLEHQLIITAAHAFFENQGFKLCDLLCMVDAIWNNRVEWDSIAELVIKDNWFQAFYSIVKLANHVHGSFYREGLIKQEVFDILEKRGSAANLYLAKKLIAKFDQEKKLPVSIPTISITRAFVSKVFKNKNDSLSGKIQKVSSTGLQYIKHRLPPRKGFRALLVCFSGQDGTGKTAHAQALQLGVENMIHVINDEPIEKNFRVKYVWSRGIGTTIEPFLRVTRELLLGHEPTNIKSYSRKRESLLSKEPARTLWAYTSLADEVIQLIGKVKIPLMQRNIIICDRYIYDAFIDIECGLNKSISWPIKEILTKMLPKPEIGFIADAPTAEIIKRKQDIELKIISRKKREYLSCLHNLGFFLIDTSKDFKKNRKDVLSKVLEVLMF